MEHASSSGERLGSEPRSLHRKACKVAAMWSPQHYISIGQQTNVDPLVLENAVDQIDRVLNGPHSLPSILTLAHLAKRANVSYEALRAIVERSCSDPYKHFRIRKRSGGSRTISVPDPLLMQVQRWIATHVLRSIPTHTASYAFSPENSIAKCAFRHRRARWIVKMDVADFFGSVTELQVYRVFKSLGYQPLISFELARICTHEPENSKKHLLKSWQVLWPRKKIESYQREHMGRLPQGAPTSPMLSNLIMREIDTKIEAVSCTYGVVYTRYSDDLTFSTRSNLFDRTRAKSLIADVSVILKASGFFPQRRKCVVVPPGARKIVLGLVVDDVATRLPRKFKSKLRQHLYYLKMLGPFEHAKARQFDTLGGMYRHIRGLIDFANMVEPDYAAARLAEFNSVSWPMSK